MVGNLEVVAAREAQLQEFRAAVVVVNRAVVSSGEALLVEAD